jgi:hypothetical protein
MSPLTANINPVQSLNASGNPASNSDFEPRHPLSKLGPRQVIDIRGRGGNAELMAQSGDYAAILPDNEHLLNARQVAARPADTKSCRGARQVGK